MTRPIKEGDIVNVIWTDESELQNVKVLHIPQNTGDLWYFEYNEKIWGVNPSSASFDCIVMKK